MLFFGENMGNNNSASVLFKGTTKSNKQVVRQYLVLAKHYEDLKDIKSAVKYYQASSLYLDYIIKNFYVDKQCKAEAMENFKNQLLCKAYQLENDIPFSGMNHNKVIQVNLQSKSLLS